MCLPGPAESRRQILLIIYVSQGFHHVSSGPAEGADRPYWGESGSDHGDYAKQKTSGRPQLKTLKIFKYQIFEYLRFEIWENNSFQQCASNYKQCIYCVKLWDNWRRILYQINLHLSMSCPSLKLSQLTTIIILQKFRFSLSEFVVSFYFIFSVVSFIVTPLNNLSSESTQWQKLPIIPLWTQSLFSLW